MAIWVFSWPSLNTWGATTDEDILDVVMIMSFSKLVFIWFANSERKGIKEMFYTTSAAEGEVGTVKHV